MERKVEAIQEQKVAEEQKSKAVEEKNTGVEKKEALKTAQKPASAEEQKQVVSSEMKLVSEDTEKKTTQLSTREVRSTIVEEPVPDSKTKSDASPGTKKLSVALKESPQLEAVKTTETLEMATPDSPTTIAEHDFLRPNFTLRLKPTTAINEGGKLKLEVRFIAQPEPAVRKMC